MASNITTRDAKAPTSPPKGLTAKDILLDAIFGMLTFIVCMSIAMVFSISTDLAWWTHGKGSQERFGSHRGLRNGASGAFDGNGVDGSCRYGHRCRAMRGYHGHWKKIEMVYGHWICHIHAVLVVRDAIPYPFLRCRLRANGRRHGHDGRVWMGPCKLDKKPDVLPLRCCHLRMWHHR